MIISSKHNPKIKALVSLRKRKEREALSVTLVEGFNELSVALACGTKPAEVYICPELMESTSQMTVLADMSEVPVFELSRAAFEKAAYRESPDGWLAIMPSVERRLQDLTFDKPSPLIIIAEAVEKPGNLGAILRTGDAAGVDAVISVDAVTDWSNPNVVRASKGAVFSVPVANATSGELQQWLQMHHIATVAATPDTDQDYADIDYTGPTAILVGTEKQGLTKQWLNGATHRARIPMFGKVDSLNVSVSAAIITYEAVRQRLAK